MNFKTEISLTVLEKRMINVVDNFAKSLKIIQNYTVE